MLADGQDLVGSYIILHLSLVNIQLREAVYYIYIHIHVTMDGVLPHSIPHGHRYCVSISTIYDIILFGHTSAHNNTVHQALMCLVTHCRSQTAADSQVFKDDIFIYDVCYLCS